MSMYPPERMLQDFAERTLKNIICIHEVAAIRPCDAFEVTETINALLGIIVFPQQIGKPMIPDIPLSSLPGGEWPQSVISVSNEFLTLRRLMDSMRNSIAHGDLAFIGDEKSDIARVSFGGKFKRNGKSIKWTLTMSVSEVSTLVRLLCELYLSSQAKTSFSRRA